MVTKIWHFFHRKTNQRRSLNTIKGVRYEVGVWRSKEQDAEAVFIDYFQALSTTSGDKEERHQVLAMVQPKVTRETNRNLCAPYSREEVILYLKQMHPTKALGPHGMPATFCKNVWLLVSEDMLNFVLDNLNNNTLIRSINNTHILLIPKKKECESTKDYRPISLCNVLYKLVSKTISNRLVKILPDVISECQSAFVPSRLITNYILVVYELFQYLRRKK